MDDTKNTGLVLLTYKGKALLMYKTRSPIDEEKHNWTMIGVSKKENESLKETLSKAVEKEASIKIDQLELVSDNFYHARLTDDNVNQIKRHEGQLLDFFTLRDLQNLKLESFTKAFVLKFGKLI